ncbi:hypothetical protein IPP75_02895 [Candidatus Saccharibacteria bacterium]|nr:MAG: hypothetical protein IPP75_02895 [Candidatus Saccharibacteria bacterium]
MGIFRKHRPKGAEHSVQPTSTQVASWVEMSAAWASKNVTGQPPVYDFPAVPTAVLEIIRMALGNENVHSQTAAISVEVISRIGATGILGGLYQKTALGPDATEEELFRLRFFRNGEEVIAHLPLYPEDGAFVITHPDIANLVLDNTPQGTKPRNISQIGADPLNPLGSVFGVGPWASSGD